MNTCAELADVLTHGRQCALQATLETGSWTIKNVLRNRFMGLRVIIAMVLFRDFEWRKLKWKWSDGGMSLRI